MRANRLFFVGVLSKLAAEKTGKGGVMTDERRRYERVGIPLEARWEGLAGRHAARISDISLGGCYVETLGQVAEGERVNFEIQLPTERWLPLRGEVAHYYPHMGFGLRFIDLTEAEQDVLARLIEYVRGY